jgi:hypothetical protein
MLTSPTPDDLLALARFCWPEQAWATRVVGDPKFTPDSVAAAEAILIERGLGSAYADALGKLVCMEWVQVNGQAAVLTSQEILCIATAPLDARVRAMVQVVRAEEAKSGQ